MRARARLFGEDILGDGVSLHIEIRRGAGAYICGEETALINSIEGKRGEPRNKPPFPGRRACSASRPSSTTSRRWSTSRRSSLEGGAAFAAIGTEQSTGTKLFCVSGNVVNPGVYEVPFGDTLRDVLDLAGGIPNGRLQAILLGGAAGVFVAAHDLDMPLTFEGARAAKATLGSGVIVAFDDTVDMRGILLRIASFFRDESCGQCVPCRVGTVRQEEALHRIANDQPLGCSRRRSRCSTSWSR